MRRSAPASEGGRFGGRERSHGEVDEPMNRTMFVTAIAGAIALAACSSDKTTSAYDAPKPLDSCGLDRKFA